MCPAKRAAPDRLARIRELNRDGDRSVLVIDDDPTGSQTVHGVRLITDATDTELVAAAAARGGELTFVLTNSRAFEARDARAINYCVGAAALGGPHPDRVLLVSRGDSTLRGHVIDEVDALDQARLATTGRASDLTVFCPAFVEVGRITVDDVHYVVDGGSRVPVAETPFARDPAFGFASSNLADFLRERAGDDALQVVSISLDDVRGGGEQRVQQRLNDAPRGAWVVLNAETPEDIEVLAEGICLAAGDRPGMIVRSGPSLVRALAGQETSAPLTPATLSSFVRAEHGLVVVGSHVPLTTSQLDHLREHGGVNVVEVDVMTLLSSAHQRYQAELVDAAVAALEDRDVVLATSRAVELPIGGELLASRTVASRLADVVAAIARRSALGWVIGKGGITSHVTAVEGLGIGEGTVAGQFFSGQVSALVDLEPARGDGVDLFVIFPGNVGAADSLTRVVEILRDSQQIRGTA